MTQATPPSPGTPMIRPHRGTMILVLGILSLVFGCVILGIIAWIMGNADLREMAGGRMDPAGEGLTKAGKICGMISVILTVVGLCFYGILVMFVLGGAAAGAAGGP